MFFWGEDERADFRRQSWLLDKGRHLFLCVLNGEGGLYWQGEEGKRKTRGVQKREKKNFESGSLGAGPLPATGANGGAGGVSEG